MKAFRVVADSSCLIGLAQAGLFSLLNDLFSEIYIPRAVYEEVVVKGKGEVGAAETESAIQDGWISAMATGDEMAVNALGTTLGKGESETIILCKEIKADYALIDERTARSIAELMDVSTVGVIGIIDLAIKAGFSINKRKIVDQLRETGFRIGEKLYRSMFPDTE